MEDVFNIIVNNGVAVGVVVYFIYKDLKTSQATLQATKEQTESNQKLIDKIEQLIVTLTGGGKNNGGK